MATHHSSKFIGHRSKEKHANIGETWHLQFLQDFQSYTTEYEHCAQSTSVNISKPMTDKVGWRVIDGDRERGGGGGGERQRQTDRHRQRQRQRGGGGGTETDRQTHKHTETEKDKQTDRQTKPKSLFFFKKRASKINIYHTARRTECLKYTEANTSDMQQGRRQTETDRDRRRQKDRHTVTDTKI